eukprot:TRINITY_DN15299_c0_g1_i2.p1 TRINITY_DN15299_c0_g1~~TRINITY_DN15299_c0_g1_i2.p1  ORF type:complete len:311 (-),score=48.05 TRINITY_DN15299_c0_g1_i2:207-1139(-)
MQLAENDAREESASDPGEDAAIENEERVGDDADMQGARRTRTLTSMNQSDHSSSLGERQIEADNALFVPGRSREDGVVQRESLPGNVPDPSTLLTPREGEAFADDSESDTGESEDFVAVRAARLRTNELPEPSSYLTPQEIERYNRMYDSDGSVSSDGGSENGFAENAGAQDLSTFLAPQDIEASLVDGESSDSESESEEVGAERVARMRTNDFPEPSSFLTPEEIEAYSRMYGSSGSELSDDEFDDGISDSVGSRLADSPPASPEQVLLETDREVTYAESQATVRLHSRETQLSFVERVLDERSTARRR